MPLTGFDDLFQINGEAQTNGERVQDVPLSELFPFKDHPCQVTGIIADAKANALYPLESCGLIVTWFSLQNLHVDKSTFFFCPAIAGGWKRRMILRRAEALIRLSRVASGFTLTGIGRW